MYPTLYHFFLGVFGWKIPFLQMIPMLGFWIGIAFLAANWFGARELKRREKLGWVKSQKKIITIGKPASIADLIINGLYGFLIGFKLIPLFYQKDIFNDFVGYLLSEQGNIVAGIIAGIAMAFWKYWEANKEKLKIPEKKEIEIRPHEHLGNITLIGILGGISGALIFAFLEQPGVLWKEFMKTGDISDLYGGLTVYGGVILAVIGNVIYFIKSKLSVSQYLDALGPTVLLAYGIGRIGCQMAGDGDWGIDNLEPKPEWMSFLPDWLWSFDYPNNINGYASDGSTVFMENSIFEEKYSYRLKNKVFPTPIYEIIMSFGLFAAIWNVRKKVIAPFVMFSLYLLATGAERLLIERIRVNVEYGSGLTQAEIISIILIILGIVGTVFFHFKYKKRLAQISSE